MSEQTPSQAEGEREPGDTEPDVPRTTPSQAEGEDTSDSSDTGDGGESGESR